MLAGLSLAGCASSGSSQGSAPGASSSPTSSAASGGESTGNTSPGMGGTASGAPSSAIASASAAAIAATCPNHADSANQNNPQAKTVPADLQVAWVLRCTIVSKGGNPQTLVAERSVTDPSKLVTALQTPSAQRAKVVCPMLAPYVPFFALVESNGTVFVPKVPLNNCGQPQLAVTQALNSLKFTELTSRPLK